ncbi:tigger transposable element-derived protein 7-like [Octopus sinensis]|uniref:Tigger transposable element-derived protein 7-like n=1 Tax=Octopus sinensis TaxID=2607531 RepID=A0A6P7TVL7_9MOLL|nr:tigger transposable element-derived protein 7-like [Octopus sinensis]
MYSSSKNAWMTRDIFIQWLFLVNERIKMEKRKILIILDNASCHENKSLSNIELLFLPKNTTPILQPLDNGIIKAFKDNYSKALIEFICCIDEEDFYCDLLKKINLRQSLIIVSKSWQNVSSEIITNCWDNTFGNEIFVVSDNLTDDVIEQVVDEVLENTESSDNEEIFYSGMQNKQTTVKEVVAKVNELEESVLDIAPILLNDFYCFRQNLFIFGTLSVPTSNGKRERTSLRLREVMQRSGQLSIKTNSH